MQETLRIWRRNHDYFIRVEIKPGALYFDAGLKQLDQEVAWNIDRLALPVCACL